MSWRCSLVAVLPLVAAHSAAADTCRIVDVQFTPASSKLQIAGWIEDTAGNYVDTIYVTQQVGLYGLGNRPGRFDLNSGPTWPYGRRLTVFPVWSHKHGKTFSVVQFQNLQDDDISQLFSTSSQEKHFCRPMLDTETGWDTGSCASSLIFTDKGAFTAAHQQACGRCANNPAAICYTDGQCSASTCTIAANADGGTCAHHADCCSGFCDNGTCSGEVRYPPRTDLTRQAGPDSPSVTMYAGLAPWDAVSAATPPAGSAQDVVWVAPPTLAPGNYVAWIEVGLEFDPNATYNATTYPSPSVPFGNYGEAYRGQPSILYQVPFAIGASESIATTSSYAGYGDPEGVDGKVRAPDATITTDTPASGASRLQLVSSSGSTFRVRVDAHPEVASVPPDAPSQLAAPAIANQSVTVTFVAPGATSTAVRGYDVRIRADAPITDANFDTSMPIAATVRPGAPGAQITFDVTGLLPSTDYYIGVRAYDVCKNTSPVAMLAVRTTDPKVGEVSACFVATAAYGTAMANEVEMLRHFRDSMLRSTVIGELAVETYYTFGPPVAGVVGESDLLRHAARDLLAPLVRMVRKMSW